MNIRNRQLFAFIGMVLVVFTAGCLKTRAQLRSDETESSADSPPPTGAPGVQRSPQQHSYAIDEIHSELTRQAGRIEDLERAASKQGENDRQAFQESLQKLEKRINELEQGQAELIEAFKKLSANVPETSPGEAFAKGKSYFSAGQYDQAIEAFGKVMAEPNSKHAEEATFLRGEAYYAQKNYNKAILEYGKFVDTYPRSKFRPDALFKLGLSFDALGMREDAKPFYQELVDKFPKAPGVKEAKKKLGLTEKGAGKPSGKGH